MFHSSLDSPILPLSEEITSFLGDPTDFDNQKCPCSKAGHHLLHSKKDVLVHYRGGIWSWKCAFPEQMRTLLNEAKYWKSQFLRIKKENESIYRNLTGTRSQLMLSKELSREVLRFYGEDACHKPSCITVQSAEAGRDPTEVECNCGVTKRIERYLERLRDLDMSKIEDKKEYR